LVVINLVGTLEHSNARTLESWNPGILEY
jgi:hypothetical protein